MSVVKKKIKRTPDRLRKLEKNLEAALGELRSTRGMTDEEYSTGAFVVYAESAILDAIRNMREFVALYKKRWL